MSIAKGYSCHGITVYCADVHSVFRPFPAKDDLLCRAVGEDFVLPVSAAGETPFQIILSSDHDLTVTDVSAAGLTCLSVEGVDIGGNPFRRTMPVKAGKPWPLWCLLNGEQIEREELPIRISCADQTELSFAIRLQKTKETVYSADDRDSFARLAWLNSTEGNENTVPRGFSPVVLNGNTVKLPGRDITVAPDGNIQSIQSYFVGNNSTLSETAKELLAVPLGYRVTENGQPLDFRCEQFAVSKNGDISVEWEAVSSCGGLRLTVCGTVEFDGSGRLSAKLENGNGRNLSVQLVHSPRRDFARYFMGLGLTGRAFPAHHTWKWDREKHQDAVWSGSVNGGVFLRPTDENAARPLVNIYFHYGKKNLPESWVNGGKGSFSLTGGEHPVLTYDSGTFSAGAARVFCADWAVSPFRLVNLNRHWNTRYYHQNYNHPYDEAAIRDAKEHGCTHINVHHGNDILPFLNYPMYDVSELKKFADAARSAGMGVKPYYTIRELTTRLPELPAFRSLRDEIYPRLTGDRKCALWQNGIDPYLTENFGNEAIPAWKHTFSGGKYDGTTDPTVITDPDSRLGNFYVASIAWVIQNVGIDGLYLDDVGYGKTVMRRVRRVFDRYRSDAKIDFHSWNHFEDDIGAGFGHNVLIYMELLPYIDSLWLGEGFDYDSNSAEYLLTEVSGLPFGLMGEMLEGNCNVWRGMLFGMTSRYPYYGYYSGPSPVPVWNLRQSFDRAEMIGFWEEKKPVTSDRPDVLCTSYVDHESGRMLCCFANFSDGAVCFTPCLESPEGRRISVPFVQDIQEERTLMVGESVLLPEKGGVFLIVD